MPISGATPNSSFTGYCTGADLVAARDLRQWGDCLNDDNTRATEAQVLSSAVNIDGTLYRAIRWASGTIEAAVTAGMRYRPEDLLELMESQTIPASQNGDGVTVGFVVGRDLLVGLACDLAYWWAVKRRKVGAKPEQIAGVAEALDLVERLRLGERIFPIRDTQDAGLAAVTPMDEFRNAECEAVPITLRASRFFGSGR